MSTSFPLIMTKQGAVPNSPASLNAGLIAEAVALAPGLTTNLPGSLIEDISSTDTGALIILDQTRVDTVNSLTPYGANEFLLNQLGQVYGVQQGVGSNTSVYVVFTGTPGFVVSQGFVVSDGTYQYVVQDGGIVGAGSPYGTTVPLYCVASQAGTWAVPANTVTSLSTSVPGTITLSATNPNTGVPGATAQSDDDYRAQVLQAGQAVSQGMPITLRTLLGNVPGVQARLVSTRSATTSGRWEIIVGGGDPYQVAYAIFTALFDVSTLTGSTLQVTGFTNANPGVVTTSLNHGYADGQACGVSGVTPTPFNGSYTATVIDEKTFSVGVDTTGFGTYASGGIVTPNLRNVSASVIDYPDTFQIPFVIPPQQTVSMAVTWNTSSSNIVSSTAVYQLAAAALADYVNSVYVGQPLNIYEMQNVFKTSIASLVPSSLITYINFVVSINDVVTDPEAGTGVIFGDPESYFSTTEDQIAVVQG